MVENDEPNSVVLDIVDRLGLFAGSHGTDVSHEQVTLESPIREMTGRPQPATASQTIGQPLPAPAPPDGPSPQRPQPPETIDGFAAAYSHAMGGPPPGRAPSMPSASAPPLDALPTSTPQHFSTASSDADTLEDVKLTLNKYIEHTDKNVDTIKKRTERNRNSITEVENTTNDLLAGYHKHDKEIEDLSALIKTKNETIQQFDRRLKLVEAMFRQACARAGQREVHDSTPRVAQAKLLKEFDSCSDR